MFNTAHIIFLITTFICITSGQILASKFVHSDKSKITLLRVFAILTVIIHYSSLYVDFLTTGSAVVNDTMLFMIYPCNVAMWFLLICALTNNRTTTLYRILAEFTFYLGIVGGIIGLVFNEIYANNPTFACWDSVKGLFSHATMLFGSIYLLNGGFIQIRVRNTLSVIYGMTFLLIDGLFVVLLFKAFGLNVPNTMYLLNLPFSGIRFINTLTIGIFAVLLVFIITSVYQHLILEKRK